MNKMTVEVAYATLEQQILLSVACQEGATVHDIIMQSGILTRLQGIDLTTQKLSIFSKPCHLSTKVKPNDRIEFLRPLIIDPKEARRAKAKQQKLKK